MARGRHDLIDVRGEQMPSIIEAAGGVLWRPANGRFDSELALVHRPDHDDWSLPKGKLLPGEHAVLGALREVVEETGYRSAVGPPLGSTRYLKDGAPKRVRYWALRARQGRFTPNSEVDDLVWLPPDAAGRLARGRDRSIITAYNRQRAHRAWPVLLVRHGQAVASDTWTGSAQDRPLDSHGWEQAAALARLLDAYAVERVLAADNRRCRETLQPLAVENAIAIEIEPLFTKGAVGDCMEAAVAQLMDLATTGVPTVICAQRSVVTRLFDGLAVAFGNRQQRRARVGKSGFYALHLRGDGPVRMSALEQVATSA